ncbi:hypothetical protein D5086_033251 [Populus alba]|uniref:Uncharacterized protein n=1 Tax=Populus alba TaxID=43335 RepID=A0ACC4AGE9_POPAL
MSQLLHFSSLNPDAPIIDPLDSIQRLHDRILMLQVSGDAAVDFVEEVAKAMKEETGISLLNFDVIRDARDANRYLIIDINYFPGYEKIPNYESVLTDFLLHSMEKNKSGDVSMVREHDDD